MGLTNCPYKKGIVCEEDRDCIKCPVYADTMPIPWDVPKELPYICKCGELICNPKEEKEHKCK